MAKAVEVLRSVGSSVESEVARRVDGVWFKRHNEHTRWGWHMTRWTRCPEPTRWSSANGWHSFGYVEFGKSPESVRLPNG